MSQEQKIAAGVYFGSLSFKYQRAASLLIFELESLDAVGIKASWRVASLVGNAVDNAAYANEQNAAAKKDSTASNQERDDGSQFDQARLRKLIKR